MFNYNLTLYLKMNKSQKKTQYIKKLSYYYPFLIDIKIISGENLIQYLLKRVKLIHTFNTNTKHSIKFGLNSIIKYINKPKENNKILIFIFYRENMESLYDLLLIRNKNNKNIKILFLDEDYNKEFVNLFKIKTCMGFLITRIQNNEKVFDEIENNLSQYIFNSVKNK